mmetsp:Transcript_64924/g.89158  ORF Transcript_64924/g.89158 Transcript_64924/m.89158 type:complete len:588 (-) Transcript_64924:188-1951(-)
MNINKWVCYMPLVAILVTLLRPPKWAGHRSPIILVPGLGGSQMEGRLHQKKLPYDSKHMFCNRESKGWFALWFNAEPMLTPGRFECWSDNVRLEWDYAPATSPDEPGKENEATELPRHHATPRAPAGVETRVPGWGTTGTIERLDANAHHLDWLARRTGQIKSLKDVAITIGFLNPFVEMVERFVKERGYTRNTDLRAAPYDFRLAPTTNKPFKADMKALIEETRLVNGNSPVTIIAHSMGGLYVLSFLQDQSDSWVAKNVLRLILIAVPLAGSPRAISMLLSGDDFDVPLASPLGMRAVQRTFDSPYVLLPHSEVWGDNETLVVTPTRNYSAKDYEQLFTDARDEALKVEKQDDQKLRIELEAEGMLAHLRRVGNTTHDLRHRPPRVPVLCLHGRGVPTPAGFVYGKAKEGQHTLDQQPNEILKEDGDGTASLRSTRLCEMWEKRLGSRLEVVGFENISHFDLMRDRAVVDLIMQQLQDDMMERCSLGKGCAGFVSLIWYWQHWRWTRWRHRWAWVPAYVVEKGPRHVMKKTEEYLTSRVLPHYLSPKLAKFLNETLAWVRGKATGEQEDEEDPGTDTVSQLEAEK